MQSYVVTRFMATYGSRPFDTLDFAEAKRPEEATEPPWGPSRKTPRSHRALPARAGQDLAIIFFVILAAVAIGGSIQL